MVARLLTRRQGTDSEFWIGRFIERVVLECMAMLCFPRTPSQLDELVRYANLRLFTIAWVISMYPVTVTITTPDSHDQFYVGRQVDKETVHLATNGHGPSIRFLIVEQ